MTFPIFIDANIPIYASGGEHPLRAPSLEVLQLVAGRRDAFVTSAEILQELLHRYVALRRWPEGSGLFQRFARLMEAHVEPILPLDVERAASLADGLPTLEAHDLLHLAVMSRIGADSIVSADRGFDHAPGIRRLDPADVALWRAEVGGSMR